jgi:hypothetical protein
VTLGTCYSVWMTVWYSGCTLHTRQSSTQNNKYQVSHKHSCFSWWWARSRPKHVEIDKYAKNKLCTKLALFTRLRTQSPAYYYIIKNTLYTMQRNVCEWADALCYSEEEKGSKRGFRAWVTYQWEHKLSWKQMYPVILSMLIAYHTPNLMSCNGTSWITMGFLYTNIYYFESSYTPWDKKKMASLLYVTSVDLYACGWVTISVTSYVISVLTVNDL